MVQNIYQSVQVKTGIKIDFQIINYKQQQTHFNMSKANTETVKVMVRVRPMNKKEQGLGCKSVVKVDKGQN